jgi:HK97 gp10 family phage protein
MSAEIEIEAEAFADGFDQVATDFHDVLVNQTQDIANQILNRAKQLVHVQSGETRDSLKVVSGEENGQPFFDIGTTLKRAVYEEFGTTEMSPIPFLRPAFSEAT